MRLALALAILLAAVTGCAESRLTDETSEARLVETGLAEGADGVSLFYQKVGRGNEAVIYLHGGPGSTFHGNGDLMYGLARGRTLIAYDQRGGGRSEVVTNPARLRAEDHVRDLETLRRHFGLERMSLIGLSWGAGLATLYAAQYPERVERMLLISPISPTRAFASARAAHLDSLLGPGALARRDAIRTRLSRAGDNEAIQLCEESIDMIFRLYLADSTPERLALARLRCDIRPDAIRNRPNVETATMASLGDWDFRPLLRRLTMPVLVMEGAHTNVPLDATRAWVSALPNARLLLVDRAGHEFFLEQPQAFERSADQFLRGRFPADSRPR
jgi:proline iminopeptidase